MRCSQMPETPELAPFNMKDQHLFLKVLQGDVGYFVRS